MHRDSSKLEISTAAVLRWHRDVFDNSVAVATFSEPTDKLTIASEVTIEHDEEAPLDFLIAEYALSYPFVYGADERVELLPYQQLASPADQDALRDWVLRARADRDLRSPAPTKSPWPWRTVPRAFRRSLARSRSRRTRRRRCASTCGCGSASLQPICRSPI